MRNFPFDEQICEFKFGSWTFDENKLDLRLSNDTDKIDLREYVHSSEWEVSWTSAKRQIRKYQFFDDDPYPELIFTLKIRRQSTFYVLLLVLPCVLLSCLTLVLFWIPANRPDRTAVGMSVFSSFFILLLILVQSSPPTSASISLLGIYFCINMVLIALSTILSVIVINLRRRAFSHYAPKWLLSEKLDIIARLLLASDVLSIVPNSPRSSKCKLRRLGSKRASKINEKHNLETSDDSDDQYENADLYGEDTEREDSAKCSCLKKKIARRWLLVSSILDRIFFVTYFCTILLALAFVFPRN
ncbi:DgyrCDS5680 [Dimorphilus gyrociliatus]|nr:DgyrCDS5680 [Dimorphilus gyrociliatus]